MKINELLEDLEMFTILIFANTGFIKKFPFVDIKDEILIFNGDELINLDNAADKIINRIDKIKREVYRFGNKNNK